MSAADNAYEFARQLIAEAKRTGMVELALNRPETLALTVLPPEIGEFGGCRVLELDHTRVTNLAPLAGMIGLSTLSLNNTQVANLAPLARLTGLRNLWLAGTQVTNLAPLAGLARMEWLVLDATQVTDFAPLAGMTGLRSLSLNRTQFADLAPLAGMTRLKWLFLGDTRVTNLALMAELTGIESLSLNAARVVDLGPLSGLTKITMLGLEGSEVFDLRPIRKLTGLVENPYGAGLVFKDTPATRADAQIARIAEVEDPKQRARELFRYLEDWVPPVVQVDAPEPDALLAVTMVDGQLEIAASLPSEAERDERLKRVLHERLRPKAAELAQLAGNRFPWLAARARALLLQVDRPFDDLDMLALHLEVEDLSASLARGAERGGEEAYTPDVADALGDVVRIGPGLTLDNADVERLEERKRRYAADPPTPEVKAAHDALSVAVAGDERAIGDRLRALEARIMEAPEAASSGAVQDAAHRNLLIRAGRMLAGNIIGGVAGNAVYALLTAHSPEIAVVASSYGTAFAHWFLPLLDQARELAGMAANVEMRPLPTGPRRRH